MNFRRMRALAMGAAATALLIAVTACTAAAPTDIIVYTTATPAPTAPPTPIATPTPIPTPTPAPTDTPVAGSPTPVPTAKASATPTVGPKGPAGGCSGDADKRAFFADAANKLPFAVYCAALPSGWTFASANYTQPSGGVLNVTYKGPAGAQIALQEGAFCTTSAGACSPHDKVIGPAKFGDLAGTLDTLGSGFAIYVSAGTTHGYTAKGTGVTQATFTSIVAALVKVPKS